MKKTQLKTLSHSFARTIFGLIFIFGIFLFFSNIKKTAHNSFINIDFIRANAIEIQLDVSAMISNVQCYG